MLRLRLPLRELNGPAKPLFAMPTFNAKRLDLNQALQGHLERMLLSRQPWHSIPVRKQPHQNWRMKDERITGMPVNAS